MVSRLSVISMTHIVSYTTVPMLLDVKITESSMLWLSLTIPFFIYSEAADSILAKSNLNPTAKEFVFKTPVSF